MITRGREEGMETSKDFHKSFFKGRKRTIKVSIVMKQLGSARTMIFYMMITYHIVEWDKVIIFETR